MSDKLSNVISRLINMKEVNDLMIGMIENEMRYLLPWQHEQSIWRGEYCGRCTYKSRSYEGGECPCDDEIRDIKSKYNRHLNLSLEMLKELIIYEPTYSEQFVELYMSEPDYEKRMEMIDEECNYDSSFVEFINDKINILPIEILLIISKYSN